MINATGASSAAVTKAADQVDPGVIYTANGIHITKEIASIRGISYSLNGIGSVRVASPNNGAFYVFGGIMLVVGWSSTGTSKVAVAILLGLALLCFMCTKRMPHLLVIHTASGDQSVLKGTKPFLFEVKSALEKAITMRG